jgi:hypothetical protein
MSNLFKALATFAAVFLLGSIARAQQKPEYHLNSLSANDPDAAVAMKFYVAGVYDGRQFTNNIGTVQKGMANRQVLANFEKPFLEEVTTYLTNAYPKKDGLYPVWVRINDLYVSEYTEKNEETGYASVVMDVMVKENGNLYIEGTYGGNVESSSMDVTKYHPLRIKQALNKCLGLYEVMLPEDRQHEPFTEDKTKREIPLKPAEGIYSSYLDMVKNKPLAGANYYIQQDKKDGSRYYVINRTNSMKCDNYYAYSDGENVYLNVTRYTHEKYYVKTERIANKFFIDKIAYDQNKAITQMAMYQLAGIAGWLATSDISMPLMVDCYSGQPFFLSNNGIKTLLEPKPQLYTEYKKSRKTPEDIKAVIKKYYELHTGK